MNQTVGKSQKQALKDTVAGLFKKLQDEQKAEQKEFQAAITTRLEEIEEALRILAKAQAGTASVHVGWVDELEKKGRKEK